MKKIEDIRQSEEWSRYLSSLGWKIHLTSSGVRVLYKTTPLGKIVKIQRPDKISCEDILEIEKTLANTLLIKIEFLNKTDLTKCGFATNGNPLLPPSTIYIDLEQSEEDLKRKMSRSAKYSVNRATRENNKVDIYTNPADSILKEFHEILKYTGRCNHFYVQPFSDLITKRNIFGDSAFLITVRDREKLLLGGIFYLGYKNTIWSIHVATGKVQNSNKGNYLLVWNAITHFKMLGYKIMDMEGIKDSRFPSFTKGWGGFSEFKRRFGGEVVEFPYPKIKIYNPPLRLLNSLPGINL